MFFCSLLQQLIKISISKLTPAFKISTLTLPKIIKTVASELCSFDRTFLAVLQCDGSSPSIQLRRLPKSIENFVLKDLLFQIGLVGVAFLEASKYWNFSAYDNEFITFWDFTPSESYEHYLPLYSAIRIIPSPICWIIAFFSANCRVD